MFFSEVEGRRRFCERMVRGSKTSFPFLGSDVFITAHSLTLHLGYLLLCRNNTQRKKMHFTQKPSSPLHVGVQRNGERLYVYVWRNV